MQFDPATLGTRETYFLMISAIVPRPIAWVSTRSKAGVVNVAPFSYFSPVCTRPPMLSLAIGHKRVDGVMVKKDTWRNAEETGELVVNIASERMVEALNATSAELPHDVSEVDHVGLETEASELIAPPRVKGCPVQMECKLDRVLVLGDPPLQGLLLAEVLRFHVDEGVWDASAGAIDPAKLLPLSRLGGTYYAKVREIFSLPRPDWAGRRS